MSITAVSIKLALSHASALDAISALAVQLSALRACSSILAAEGHATSASEVQRSTTRAVMALNVLREELVTIEIVERYLRTLAEPTAD